MGYHSLAAARKDISSYLMGYYNQERPHAFNGGIAPVVAEEKLKTVSGFIRPLHFAESKPVQRKPGWLRSMPTNG